MKKLFGSLLLLLLVGGLSSCRNDLEPQKPGNHRSHTTKEKPIMKTIKMNFGGDFISESEEPLLRAEDGDTYTAINVFRTEKGVEGATEEKYAYGLFKKKEGIEINVVTGYTYRFEATILVEKVDKVFIINKSYAQPFQYSDDQSGMSNYHSEDLDTFKYTTLDSNDAIVENRKREYFRQLNSGTAHVDVAGDLGSLTQTARISYPRVKRYYGILDGFDPGVLQSVDIKMLYKSFGLKIEVVDLPSGFVTVQDVTRDGIKVKDPTDRLIFSKGLQLDKDTKRDWEGLYSMNELTSQEETFTLEFTWHKGGDANETFTTPVTIKPNTKKILQLNINGSPNYQTKGNISFTMENESLTDDIQLENHEF
ncbi:MAG: hypothetical protein K2K98_14845 [Muribaculaceae bacterium]|nr:hypothetical protein [Muribaculaceae bacterium]